MALSACANAPSDPYAAEVAAAQHNATSAFERQVLDDGKVTRAEYEEAEQRYVACVNAAGIQTELVDQDGHYIFQMSGSASESDEAQAQIDKCGVGTNEVIAPLYESRLLNPHNSDFSQLIVDCLIRNKIAPSDYTKKDYEAATQTAVIDSGGDVTQLTPTPSAFSLETPEALACISNPVAH